MKFSTKVRYGIRAILDIAINSNGKPVLVDSIAQRQKISKKYLDNLLTSLRVSGLVHSIRGSKGGYLLSLAPEEITLEMIFKAYEGNLTFVDCLTGENFCQSTEICAVREFWEDVTNTIQTKLSEKTIQQLIERTNELKKDCIKK